MVSQLQTVSRGDGIPAFNIGVGPVGVHTMQAGMLLDAAGAIFAVNDAAGADGSFVLDGSPDTYLSTISTALNTIVGSIDITLDISMPSWTISGDNKSYVSKSGAIFESGWDFFMGGIQIITFRWSADGVNFNSVGGLGAGFEDDSRHLVRVTRDSDDGEVNLYFDGELAPGYPLTGVTGNMISQTVDVNIGSFDNGDGAGRLVVGTIYSVRVLDGINGDVAINLDPNNGTLDGSTWTDAETLAEYTLNGNVVYAPPVSEDQPAAQGGIGFDPDGRMRISTTQDIANVGAGATPFDANGNLCVGGPIDLIYMGVGLAFDGKVASIVKPPNALGNSVWAGASGSVGGADWIPPTLWSNSFWPPNEAIALPNISGNGDTGIEFTVVTNRGYQSINVDTTALIGQTFNLSIFVDEVITGGAYANVSGGNVTIIRGFPPISNGFVGRVDAVYQITGVTIGVRFGGGVTSNSTSQFKLSRPQLTFGSDRLYPYEQSF